MSERFLHKVVIAGSIRVAPLPFCESKRVREEEINRVLGRGILATLDVAMAYGADEPAKLIECSQADVSAIGGHG